MNTSTELPDVVYFGCRGGVGHYFHTPARYSHGLHPPPGFPWGLEVDGKLQPPPVAVGRPDGLARRHVKDGWTAVAYWDRTVDRRPGSCSVLAAKGVLTTAEVVARVRAVMPDVVRLDVTEWEVPF